MKKITLFIISLSLMLSVVLPFSAGAASSEAYVYGFGGSSVNMSPSKNDVVAANGLFVRSDMVPSLNNGVMSTSAPGTSNGFIDLQMFHISSYNIKESFKLYMKIKPLQENLSMGNVIAWRQDTNDTTWDKGGISLSGGSFNIGSSAGKKLSLEDWSVVTFEYHYDTANGVFDTVTLAVDGETVGSSSCEGSPTIIKQWRLFQFGKGELAFDYIAVVPNSNTGVVLDTDTDGDAPPDTPPATPSTEAHVFGFAGDSVNTSFSASDIKKSGGIALNSGLTHKVSDGAITLYAAGEGFIDLQMYHVSEYNIKETFKLSMKLMPLQENLNLSSPIAWRVDSNDKTWDKGNIKISNGAIGVGSAMSAPLEAYKWSVIDVEYHYNSVTNAFDTFRLYVNGAYVASGACADVPLMIKHWRLFQFSTGELALDYISVIPNSNNSAVQDTDADPELGAGGGVYEGEIGVLPSLPSIDGAQKKDVEYIFSAELSADKINTTEPDVKGFYLNCLGDSSRYGLDGGALYFGDCAFAQIRVGEDVKETFTLSFRLMPLVTSLDGNSLIAWRGDENTAWESESIRLYDGQLIVNKKNCGALPVDEYTLIEVVFHYGADSFDSYSVLVNGTEVARAESASAYGHIGQIRAFQFMEGEIAVTDVCAIKGGESVLYARPYSAPVTDDAQTGDVAEEPEAESDVPETAVGESESSQRSGCGASVGMLGVVLAALCAALAAICPDKRREDR